MADQELTDVALRALLAGHRQAVVIGIGDDGLTVPLPASVPVDGHTVAVGARSAFDLVQPRDRLRVIAAWERARDEGWGRAVVGIAGTGGARGVLHLCDVTAIHGVCVGVLVALDGSDDELAAAAEVLPPPSRLVRTTKTSRAMFLEVHPDVREVLGWEPSELVGRRSLDFIHPDHHDAAIDAWMRVLGVPGGTSRARVRHQHRDGGWVWVEITNRNLLDDPLAGHVESEMLDITDEVDALDALRASEQLLRRLAGALPVGVVHVDEELQLLYANDELHRIVGTSALRTTAELATCIVEVDSVRAAVDAVLGGTDVDLELHIDPLDGGPRRRCTLALRSLTTPDGHITGAVGCVSDITDASRMRAELEHRASTDELTGCANRASAIAALGAALAASPDIAVVFVDLDRFKQVNDRFGHAVGDRVLVAVAERLRAVVRAPDVLGRIGGDEFLLVCPGTTDEEEGVAMAERVAAAVHGTLVVDGVALEVSASVGVARARPGEGADALIARADAAMYESKRRGGRRAVPAAGPCAGVVVVGDARP